MKAKGYSETKTIAINIEATQEEWYELLDSLKEYNGYGAVEDLEAIIKEKVGDRSDEEVTLTNEL